MAGRYALIALIGLVTATSAAAEDRYSLTTPVRPQMELTTSLSQELNLRFGVSQTDDLREEPSLSGFDASDPSLSALVDWRPMPGGFRVTGGALYGDLYWAGRLSGSEAGAFSASGWSRASTDAAAKRITPYLGVGWGTSFAEEDRFGVQLDMGLMFGDERDGDGNLNPGVLGSTIGDGLEAQFDGLNYTPMFSADLYFRF